MWLPLIATGFGLQLKNLTSVDQSRSKSRPVAFLFFQSQILCFNRPTRVELLRRINVTDLDHACEWSSAFKLPKCWRRSHGDHVRLHFFSFVKTTFFLSILTLCFRWPTKVQLLREINVTDLDHGYAWISVNKITRPLVARVLWSR